jgi:hypothetical protein
MRVARGRALGRSAEIEFLGNRDERTQMAHLDALGRVDAPGGSAPRDHYLDHYYGAAYFDAVRAETLTTAAALATKLDRLAAAGCDDVVLLPCSADIGQAELLARTLREETSYLSG